MTPSVVVTQTGDMNIYGNLLVNGTISMQKFGVLTPPQLRAMSITDMGEVGHVVEMNYKLVGMWSAISNEWLEENISCRADVHFFHKAIIFDNANDAMLFYLAFK